MKILAKLNPINSLFGRIFLWFWLATIVIIASAVWLSVHSDNSYSIRPLDLPSEQRLLSIARRVEIIAARRPNTSLSELLGRAGHRNKVVLMMINARNRDIIYGFPRALSPLKEPFWELLENDGTYRIKTQGGIFEGPVNVFVNDIQYKLFAGKPPRNGAFSRLQRKHPGLLLSVAILLSALLCALLTWSLVRPIRELQVNAKKIAQGDLSARATLANQRGDELGQLARDFNQMSQQLEKLIGSQKRLVADISHELRSPLARLQLAIGIAQQNDEKHEDAQLKRIEKEAQRIDKMIDQVLKLSRLEADMPQEPQQVCALNALLLDVIQDAKFEAQGAGKSVLYDAVPDITISCYPLLLCSAIHNIVANAVKYSHRQVQISFKVDKQQLVINVCDDGPGVPADELNDIFTPFYRLSSSRARYSGGVGLGLAIAQQAVLQHSGSIEARNLPDGGLQVSITLPLQ